MVFCASAVGGNYNQQFCKSQHKFGVDKHLWALVLIFNNINSIGLQFRAGRYKMPAQQQALYVASNIKNDTNQH